MARYTAAVCRLCRREGQKLYLKGQRCHTPKCSFGKKGYAPGAHGARRRFRFRSGGRTDFGLQLREKQKTRRIYGVLERQFRTYYRRAVRRKGVTGDELLRLLESRLDNVVYRGGLAASRSEARQLVRHRHFHVNGRIVDVPSYLAKPGDVVEVKESSRTKTPIAAAASAAGGRAIPEWLEADPAQFAIRVRVLPERSEIDTPVQEALVVEYYSR
ncbi:MAG: 30S ribosomal protein S4 [Armatimonadota bacterium]|jgi:small subunit ribosomal protein S4